MGVLSSCFGSRLLVFIQVLRVFYDTPCSRLVLGLTKVVACGVESMAFNC